MIITLLYDIAFHQFFFVIRNSMKEEWIIFFLIYHFPIPHFLIYLKYSLLFINLIREYILLPLFFHIFNSAGLKTSILEKYVPENKINKQQNQTFVI
jgi:hypothetical protein